MNESGKVSLEDVKHRIRMNGFILFLSFFLLISISDVFAQVESNFSAGGGIKIGTSTSICDGTTEGAIHYNSTDSIMEFCDGTVWRQILTTSGSATPPAPAIGDGYFVLTAGSWKGRDLQTVSGETDGLNAGDALCLSDLTANDWLGKSDAIARGILDAAHIKAFLCASTGCNSAQTSTIYYFAVSGDALAGGASFTTDAGGLGPNNQISWAATNYFDGSYTYYTGRAGNNNDRWGSTSWGGRYCADWNGNNGYPMAGISSASGIYRYQQTTPDQCSAAHRLICFVHPF